jgi:N-acetylmuramoyl-L-alanine amidase
LLLGALLHLVGAVCHSDAQSPPKAVPGSPPLTEAQKAAQRRAQDSSSPWKLRNYKGRSYVSLESVAKFFDFESYDVSGKIVSMVRKSKDGPLRFAGRIGEKRVTLGNLAFYFSFPIINNGPEPAMISIFDVSNVLDPVLRGTYKRDPAVLRVVVLDPAAGGQERGLWTQHGEEKELTLAVALRMKPLLEAEGFTVVLSRDDDSAVFPLERIRLANLIRHESIYISLRANVSTNPKGHGLETATLPPAATPATYDPVDAEGDKRFYPGNINDRESMALATTLHSSAVGATKAQDLGIKRLQFEELRGIEMPAIVTRLGYLSHPEEAKKLATDSYRQLLASALVGGIKNYASFLSRDLKKRQEEDAAMPLKFGNLQATHLDASAGYSGERVLLRVPILAKPGIAVDRSKLEVQLFLFERVDGTSIDLTVANPPKIEWLSVLPDWKATTTEVFQAIYDRPAMNGAEMSRMGKRNYYGFVARLIYDGYLMDEYADPKNLNRCLFYFTPVFPRR